MLQSPTVRPQSMAESETKQFLIQGDVYEVEKLVGVKIVKGKKLYRVRWRGYGRESDTLEPEENLLSCKDMIQDLEEKMRERIEKKKNRKLFKKQAIREACPIPFDGNKDLNSMWQAAEVQQTPGLKDTFWRDFDEGKINVFDQDMYSKVKERAARMGTLIENGKVPDIKPKEGPIQPLCPKVVLKRKSGSRSSLGSSMYKSSLKVKPLSMRIKKRKRYDVLRDYRKRKSRSHRKRNIDENRRLTAFQGSEKSNANGDCCQSTSNILQELLINDEKHSVLPGYVLNSKAESSVPKSKDLGNLPKDGCLEQIKIEMRKNQPLSCKITIQDKSKAVMVAETMTKATTISCMDSSTKKLFMGLLDATVHEQLDKLEKLCSNSTIINCCQDDGMTPLMIASQLGLYNTAKVLLKANAHKDKQNSKGETALMLACRNMHPKMAKLLLEYGANFALTNAEGINALRITNRYANKTVLQNILVDHIMRTVWEFEAQARCVLEHIAEIKYALFPIQCFSLNEGPKFNINFHHHVKLESPGKNGKLNLLFIANSNIHDNTVSCLFEADSLVHSVCINGVKQDLFHKDGNSVYKMAGLKNGNNKVSITTVNHPESEVKLIVCAYRVHRSVVWIPAQNGKSDSPN